MRKTASHQGESGHPKSKKWGLVAHRGSRNCRQKNHSPEGKKGGMPLLPGEKRESDQYVSGLSFFDDIGKYIKLGAERMQVPD